MRYNKTNLLRVLIFFAVVGVVVILSGCNGDAVTTPTPPNAFAVTNVDNLGGQNRGNFKVYGTYSNYDDTIAKVDGTFFFGDGASQKIEGGPTLYEKIPNGNWEWGQAFHEYPVSMRGSTVRIRVEAVAHFQSGNVEALPPYEKEFVLQ